jgi:hypothetical protein
VHRESRENLEEARGFFRRAKKDLMGAVYAIERAVREEGPAHDEGWDPDLALAAVDAAEEAHDTLVEADLLLQDLGVRSAPFPG